MTLEQVLENGQKYIECGYIAETIKSHQHDILTALEQLSEEAFNELEGNMEPSEKKSGYYRKALCDYRQFLLDVISNAKDV